MKIKIVVIPEIRECDFLDSHDFIFTMSVFYLLIYRSINRTKV
nr:MAG TPA: hypothetical protein [Bacteriophage sp.]DAX15042.1 MAG TPA: hypothetical protein [Bacteriophage sp.]